jgi:hypothetical protein
VSFAAAEIAPEGWCRVVHGLQEDTLRPIGSGFKLYVLVALGQTLAEGRSSWDERLAIREDYKSLPAGVLQNRPAGDRLALTEYADPMMSISDNTATDHLIHRLGRETVARQLELFGHQRPEVNEPLLTTKAFFQLKYVPAHVRRYLSTPAHDRTAVVEESFGVITHPGGSSAHAAWGRRAHRLEPDPETAHVVRRIFAQRLAGHSVARIARALNEAGIPCPSAVRDLTGLRKRRYLLAGLLTCGVCGRRMESAWSNGGPAYRCRHGHTTAAAPDPNRPKNAYVREDRILPHLPALHILLSGGPPAEGRRRRTRRGADARHQASPEDAIRYLREQQVTLTYDPATRTLHTGTAEAATTVTLKAS